jgi:hypothetical protein
MVYYLESMTLFLHLYKSIRLFLKTFLEGVMNPIITYQEKKIIYQKMLACKPFILKINEKESGYFDYCNDFYIYEDKFSIRLTLAIDFNGIKYQNIVISKKFNQNDKRKAVNLFYNSTGNKFLTLTKQDFLDRYLRKIQTHNILGYKADEQANIIYDYLEQLRPLLINKANKLYALYKEHEFFYYGV